MRTVHFELLRPDEIVEERGRCPVVFMPLGPLEWHGPHLPVGTDPLNAAAVAERTAEITGGVVMPTLFWGTEREKSPEKLKSIGFKGDEWIFGMDYPSNSMKSLYCSEEVLGIIMKEYIGMLIKQEYKLIVIVNGHGGVNHVNVLTRLAKEFTHNTHATVLYTTALFDEKGTTGFGHATLAETSIMKYIHKESVDVGTLPPKGQKIFNTRWSIVDSETFRGNPNSDFSVREDPREADEQLGKSIFEGTVDNVSNCVLTEMKKLNIKA